MSQSIKPFEESINDFKNFKAPLENIPVYIDHGYQPYNFSLYKNSAITDEDFEAVLNKNNISILWNYIDSGTSTYGVFNQLNRNDFTLKSFYKAIKNKPFKEKLVLLVKNIMFHFYADEDKINRYKNLAGDVKIFLKNKSVSQLLLVIKNLFLVFLPILKALLLWQFIKNKPYKYANFSPLLFKHKIANTYFYIFQTLEVVDFKSTLSKQNLEKLYNECGVVIAHTYFSVPFKYHTGRLFKDEQSIDKIVDENFTILSNFINEKKIWNPTLTELVNHLQKFEKTILDIDKEGKIIPKTNSDLIYREVI